MGGVKLFGGDWEFKVAPEEDPDWELRDLDGRRVLRLTVKKAVMPGGLSVVIWWSRVLKGDPAIDVGQISDRKKGASESFAKAWNEAHLQFKEKVKSREKVVIDAADSQDD